MVLLPSSMTATASTSILRASVAILLLPVALGFAPAISTMHLSSARNRRAGCVPSRALPRVATGPLGATMRDDGLLDYYDEQMMGEDRLAEAARRKKTVLRTGIATLSAVFVLACVSVRPASAFDGGSVALISEEVPALVNPAPPKVAKVKESKTDMQFRVAVQENNANGGYTKTTRQDLMAMNVKVKFDVHNYRGKGEHFRHVVLWTFLCGSSLMMVPWHAFRREGDLLAAPHLKRRIW